MVTDVDMVQADTGKWYAYVASEDHWSLTDSGYFTVPETGDIGDITGLLDNAPLCSC